MTRKHLAVLLALLLFSSTGCSGNPVRHLASDICLVSQGTTRQEVLTYLGIPSEQRVDQEGEIWIYYQLNKSLLRKTPFIGNRLGEEDADMVTVRFDGNQVKTCAYRHFTPEEFESNEFGAQYESGDE